MRTTEASGARAIEDRIEEASKKLVHLLCNKDFELNSRVADYIGTVVVQLEDANSLIRQLIQLELENQRLCKLTINLYEGLTSIEDLVYTLRARGGEL